MTWKVQNGLRSIALSEALLQYPLLEPSHMNYVGQTGISQLFERRPSLSEYLKLEMQGRIRPTSRIT